MKIILLLSSDETLRDEVSGSLPDDWCVERFGTLEEIVAYIVNLPEISGEVCPLLIDVEDQPEWYDKLAQLGHERVTVFLILNKLDKREIAFHRGVCDYIFKPVHPFEIKARLIDKVLREQQQTQVQENLRRQLSQNERLIILGRLTSHIVHEINNPMQAIRGAVTLALEEADVPDNLATYLKLCQQESQRVVKLVEKMRRLYRPQTNWEVVNIYSVFQDALKMASDEMHQQNVDIRVDFSQDVALVNCLTDQLQLVFLGILLNLTDILGAGGGGMMSCCSRIEDQKVAIDISVDMTMIRIEAQKTRSELPAIFEEFVGLSPAREIIYAHHGSIESLIHDQDYIIGVSLPVIIST